MPTTRGYRILVQWIHRKHGPQRHQQLSRGSSARRALNKALLSFFKDKSKRLERRDAHAAFRCEVWRIPK